MHSSRTAPQIHPARSQILWDFLSPTPLVGLSVLSTTKSSAGPPKKGRQSIMQSGGLAFPRGPMFQSSWAWLAHGRSLTYGRPGTHTPH